MLICPELQRVFILVPRTGSGTLYREILRVYPKSMLIYRHMEADGCPRGYDRWERIGFVRHPLYRLWSMYNFLRNSTGLIGSGAKVSSHGIHQADTDRKKQQVDRPFEDWLVNNEALFMCANDLASGNDFWPILTRSHPGPENKLSQFQYLRPDLGTTIWKFEKLKHHMVELGLNSEAVSNASGKTEPPHSSEIWKHIYKFCSWDLSQNCMEV